MNTHDKVYLGDGAYVQPGCYLGEVVLTTEDGVSAQNTIVLGPSELAMLRRWLEERGIWEKKDAD